MAWGEILVCYPCSENDYVSFSCKTGGIWIFDAYHAIRTINNYLSSHIGLPYTFNFVMLIGLNLKNRNICLSTAILVAQLFIIFSSENNGLIYLISL